MRKLMTGVLCALIMTVLLACVGCSSGSSGSSAASSSSASSSASASVSASVSASASAATTTASSLEDGVYTAQVETDSKMFHINDAKNGTGELTVENGEMTVHMTLASTGIVNLYVGTKEQAEADAANVLQPTTEKVTGSDGQEKEAYAFDVPVPVLGEEFDVAILGDKGTWYDHKVTVSNPVKE